MSSPTIAQTVKNTMSKYVRLLRSLFRSDTAISVVCSDRGTFDDIGAAPLVARRRGSSRIAPAHPRCVKPDGRAWVKTPIPGTVDPGGEAHRRSGLLGAPAGG